MKQNVINDAFMLLSFGFGSLSAVGITSGIIGFWCTRAASLSVNYVQR